MATICIGRLALSTGLLRRGSTARAASWGALPCVSRLHHHAQAGGGRLSAAAPPGTRLRAAPLGAAALLHHRPTVRAAAAKAAEPVKDDRLPVTVSWLPPFPSLPFPALLFVTRAGGYSEKSSPALTRASPLPPSGPHRLPGLRQDDAAQLYPKGQPRPTHCGTVRGWWRGMSRCDDGIFLKQVIEPIASPSPPPHPYRRYLRL